MAFCVYHISCCSSNSLCPEVCSEISLVLLVLSVFARLIAVKFADTMCGKQNLADMYMICLYFVCTVFTTVGFGKAQYQTLPALAHKPSRRLNPPTPHCLISAQSELAQTSLLGPTRLLASTAVVVIRA